MITSYEELIVSEIASSLSIDLKSLRWFQVIPVLPETNCELFALCDLVPSLGFTFKANDDTPKFSTIYGELLEAQKPSFINTLAIKNFQNKEYWISCNNKQEPIYTPKQADIVKALGNGASFDFSFDSTNYTITQIEIPAYPSFVINQPFLDFNETAANKRFVFTLHFDKLVHIPIQSGNWFSSAAFVTAYNNKNNWQTGTGIVTWDDLFGKNGILNFVTNGILVASGMSLTIQSYGNYDENTLNDLKSNPLTSIWPFYMNPENTNQVFELDDDGSIKMTVTTLSSEIVMLGMQAVNVKDLVGA